MRYPWPLRQPGRGHLFLNANRNKRSIVLDLKQQLAREACLALAKRADVLVYNIRPQAMGRLRLAYEDARAVNPRIIYVGCFGYSQRGPYAAKAAYDDLIQGAAGIPALLKVQGAETPRYAPIIVADRSVGQQVASAVSAALYYREKSGEGQRIDVPMFEHLLQMILGPSRRLHLRSAARAARLHPHPFARSPSLPDQGRLCLRAHLQRQAVEGVLRCDRP